MRTQRDIQGAYLRAAYSEMVDSGSPVAWFGAGAFARRLGDALPQGLLGTTTAIFDDNPDCGCGAIAGIPVRRPDADQPPAQVLLATDTHAEALRERARTLWGDNCKVIDLDSRTPGSWVDPGDAPSGFARTHPERWRESVGIAQLELETHGAIDRSERWARAHAILAGDGQAVRVDAAEHDPLACEHPVGSVVIVRSDTPIHDSERWAPVLGKHHSAISPDGRVAAITLAPKGAYPAAPLRAGTALWVPDAPSCVVESLYKGAGAKGYALRFGDGDEMRITATRERTYADLRGRAELFRYEAVLDQLPPGASVLDCACGTGPGAELLAAHGFDVTGVDVSAEAIAFARRRYPGIEFVCASASGLPFSDGRFDAVVSIETIEHLPLPAEAIAEFARVCKPGGVLCLTTPDEGECDSPFHAVELSADTLNAAIDGAFGTGGWGSEPIIGAEGWHAMAIRRTAAMQM